MNGAKADVLIDPPQALPSQHADMTVTAEGLPITGDFFGDVW